MVYFVDRVAEETEKVNLKWYRHLFRKIMKGKQNKYMKLDLSGKEDEEGKERNGSNTRDIARYRGI